jgi:integrase
MSEWLAQRSPDRFRLLVGELAVRFMQHAQACYVKNGRPTSEVHTFRAALGFVCRRYKRERAAEFSPLKLKAAREDMIRSGLSRQTIMKYQARILAVWKWAVGEELVKAEVWQALRSVPGLRAGRSAAPEAPPVLPVPEEIVNQTLPHMPGVLADMVHLQLRTGMRPAEVATLTPGDIDRSGPVWVYTVRDPKTAHRGKDRKVFIGPASQAILAPYLAGKPDMPCFRVSPRPEASAYPTAAYRRAAHCWAQNQRTAGGLSLGTDRPGRFGVRITRIRKDGYAHRDRVSSIVGYLGQSDWSEQVVGNNNAPRGRS